MQDNWGGEEMSNWEEEAEVEIGMWNNNPSQEVNQTGNWPYKKMTPKVIIQINNQDLIYCLTCHLLNLLLNLIAMPKLCVYILLAYLFSTLLSIS